MQDILIIGAGIIGCAAARELSRYKLNILVVEKEPEVSMGTSKANSGIIHAGYDCKPNTKKARLNIIGNKMYSEISKQLEIPFKRNGSLVVAFDKEEHAHLTKLYEQGIQNGVPEISLLSKNELKSIEPNISDNVYAALYAKTGGIISPYEATVAFAENAHENGVKFLFESNVIKIEHSNGIFAVSTTKGLFQAKAVINAAGLHSDDINNFLCNKKYSITPRKGEYVLFDKMPNDFVRSTIFQIPSKFGKGVLVTPTVHGNLLVGPSAEDTENKFDVSTNADILKKILQTGNRSVPLPMREIITSFAGLRANNNETDFVINQDDKTPGVFNAIGVDSPGLTAAPAIAKELAEMVTAYLNAEQKEDFIETRSAILSLQNQTIEKQNELIKADPNYGKVVCRCELVTEAEIISAIKRPLGATTVDGIKRRTRAGMGRCQAGFCTARVLAILARELGKSESEITKFGGNSYYIY